MLYYDKEIQYQIKFVYINEYWNKLNLSKVKSQKIANEIFLMAVVAGVKASAKIAQRVVGVKDDGVIGFNTLAGLNIQDENRFDRMFDKYEIKHFENLVANNEKFRRFEAGWKRRAMLV